MPPFLPMIVPLLEDILIGNRVKISLSESVCNSKTNVTFTYRPEAHITAAKGECSFAEKGNLAPFSQVPSKTASDMSPLPS
jgi:hypothetical protein